MLSKKYILGGNKMYDINFELLPKYLEAKNTENQIINQNIANYSTPGYKRKYVNFDEELKKALGNSDEIKLKTNNPSHINNTPSLEKVQAQIETDNSKSERNDGNNVDIDNEEKNLNINYLEYSTAARLMTYAIQRYNLVVRSGR